MELTKKTIEELAYGSLILGAGGGGSEISGQQTALKSLELGTPIMISIDELEDDDIVVTISGVGSPASKSAYSDYTYYNEIIQRLTKELGKAPAAIIPSEMGGASSFGPFTAAAMNNIPILNAACNGRAHPLGTMGSLGLSEQRDYITTQVAIGGNPKTNHKVELTVKGSVKATADMVLKAAVEAGGLVVTARNPVPVSYIKNHASINCYSQARELGEIYLSSKTGKDKIENIAKMLDGRVLCSGKIEQYSLNTTGGLDVGGFTINQNGKEFEVHFWNEYMAVDGNGERLYTFPDFMMTFDSNTGQPITTAHIQNGLDVSFVTAPKSSLILGAGMYEESGYKLIEKALDIPMVPYVLDILKKK